MAVRMQGKECGVYAGMLRKGVWSVWWHVQEVSAESMRVCAENESGV